MLERRVQEQKIRPKLGNGDGTTVNQKLNLYLGEMSAIIRC